MFPRSIPVNTKRQLIFLIRHIIMVKCERIRTQYLTVMCGLSRQPPMDQRRQLSTSTLSMARMSYPAALTPSMMNLSIKHLSDLYKLYHHQSSVLTDKKSSSSARNRPMLNVGCFQGVPQHSVLGFPHPATTSQSYSMIVRIREGKYN